MNGREVLLLTFPLGNGLLEQSQKYGYTHSSGMMAINEMLKKNEQTTKFLNSVAREKIVCLDGISFVQGLAEMSKKEGKHIYCYPHRICYFPEAGELAKMGFLSEDCYFQKRRLHGNVEFLHKIPLYLKDIMFSKESHGALVVMKQKDAERLKPHCVKIIGYLEDTSSSGCFSSI